MLEFARVTVGGLAKRFGLAGAAFTALAGTTAAGLWYQLFRRPLPRTEGRLRLDGLEGPVEIGRDRWGVPHIRAQTRHDLWFARGLLPRPGPPLAARPLPPDRLRAAGRDRRSPPGCGPTASCGPWACAAPPSARRRSSSRSCDRSSTRSAPGSTPAAADRPLPAEFQLLRLGFEPWRPADSLDPGQAALLRPLDQLGARAAARRDGPRAGRRAGGAARPGLSARQPGDPHPGRGVDGRRPGPRRADRAAFATRSASRPRPPARTTGRSPASSLGDRRRRCSPAIPTCRRACRESGTRSGSTSAIASAAAPRCPGMPGVFMGQNNDVAWTFTNVMADVMDLFVERIDGDTLRVRGRVAAAGADRGGDRGQGPRRARAPGGPRDAPRPDRQRGARAPTTPSRWRCASWPSTFPGSREASLGDARLRQRRRAWSRRSASTRTRSRTWSGPTATARSATRPSAASRCAAAAAPTSRSPAGRASTSGTAGSPTTSCPSSPIPDAGFVVTANNRIAADDYPHHITSDYLDGYRARRIEQLIAAQPEHDLDELRGDADGHALAPGPGDGSPAGPAAPARPARAGGDRAAALLGRADEPGLDRGDDLPGVHAAAGARGHPGRDRRPRPGGALARPRRQRLHRPRHLALALAVAPARLWEEGDEELVGRPWDELALDALRGALDDLDERFGPDQEAGAGAGSTRSTSRTRSARPTRSAPGSSTAGSRSAAARRRSPRSAGTRTTRSRRSGRPAGGWSPTRSTPSAPAGRRSPASRATRRARTTTTCRRDWLERPDAADGRRGALADADARAARQADG